MLKVILQFSFYKILYTERRLWIKKKKAKSAGEKIILEDDWSFVKQKGSHRHYKHPSKPGKVTIPFHKPDELHPKTANTILKQAGLK